jgi:protein gp37
MGKTTSIAWADSTVNPVIGCPGCEIVEDCYARRLVARHEGRKGWPLKFSEPILKHGAMDEAYRWLDLTGTERPDKPWLNGLPRMIFVSDLGDVFGAIGGPYPQAFCDAVRDWLLAELRRMAGSPHRFLMLTKWPGVARDVLYGKQCPPNFWLGVSVCDETTMHRIDTLQTIEGLHRFVSFEPLRGRTGKVDLHGIDWVIVGGQSGPKWDAQTHPEPWPELASEIRWYCVFDGCVPFFFKQQPGPRPGTEPYLRGCAYRNLPNFG